MRLTASLSPVPLAHTDFLDASRERVSAQIAERVRPCEHAGARIQTVPGVGRRTAEVLMAEIGPDLTRFPSARHLAPGLLGGAVSGQ